MPDDHLSESVNVRITAAMKRDLERIKKTRSRGTKLADIVREAIEDFLARREKRDNGPSAIHTRQ